ncbi:hypothetical protein ACN6LM_003878 [Streptomyces sp. SAS_281]|uniref:hypothetical protein n=1 Tax=Streptomyces sp. SAS_281 TaxID=3412744 RepID=UPI00403C56CE
MRPEGCTAKVSVLAEYLGMSKSEAERGLRDLATPDDVDGLAEVITTRRTLPGGRGQSAHRVVREAGPDEHFVWIPVRAAEALSPRLLRLYALVAYAAVRNQPLAVGDLGAMLYHHSGKQAGEHLGERQAARLVAELAATGWITVHERQGLQGRHAYEAHRHPLQAVQLEDAAPDIHDGSGPDSCDGSLTSREDTTTDRPLTNETAALGIRRRRDAGSYGPQPVEKRSNNGGGTPRAYAGPGLNLSSRVWSVLDPVRHELPGIRTYVMRRIGHEIGRQLEAGVGMERLTARLTRRWASTEAPHGGDVGRWILGAGLPRHGCGLAACESGVTWHTGQDCAVCADNAQERAARAQQEAVVQEQPPDPPTPLPPRWSAPARPAASSCPPPDPDSREQLRAAATPAAIRQAIRDHGRAKATYLYGHALVLPHLNALDNPEGTPA